MMTELEPSTKGGRTRTQLLNAAVERFGRNGFQATSVADISRDVSIARSAPYVYFESKDDLFYQALDHDAAGAIAGCLSVVFDERQAGDWTAELFETFVRTINDHPLARRVLGGLEPAVTARALQSPAIEDLRAAVTERLHNDQIAGLIRCDIAVDEVGGALVTIILALLMAIIQLGPESVDAIRPDHLSALVHAALHPPASS
ncbi:MAG: AcrR family transcriptional regulator [Candidatus Azotimanducaceae bacterium]|jgi:AcrR family transcriptional regulator|tara:strand:+ start:1187 stop:1795 length:609 start_codon:yes stop_codon:yes gene_type:complete